MAAIKGSSYYYKTNSGGVSSVVGYESSSRRVMRTAFTVDDSATKLTVKMKMSAGDVSYRNCQVYMAVSTDSSAYVNHTGTDGTFLGSWSGTATKEATITGLSLVPGTQYYLWFYHYADKYAWLYAYNDNLTLTASDPIYYTITYNPGSYGSGSISAGSQKYGAAFTLTSSTYTRTGYTQTGWSLDTEDGTAEYSIGQSFPAGSSFSKSCTLYPTWTANKYTITLNANGGAFSDGATTWASPSDPSVTYMSSNYYSVNWLLPIRTGYRFLGWYTSASGGTKIYNSDGVCVPGTSYWNSSNQWIYAGNATFYAHWEKIEYTISFDANGGTVNPASQVIGYPNGKYDSLPTPINSGKKFTGWFVDIGNNGPINLGKEYKYPSSSGLTVAFDAYMEDWSTISTATLISCTEGGGWNLWFNNGTLMSEIMTTSSTAYKNLYPGNLKASDLKSGWHTFTVAISNAKGIAIWVDQTHRSTDTCSELKYVDPPSLWLGGEASSDPNYHSGTHVFPGLIRNFTIENRVTTGITPVVGSFAIPNQNAILYADWESTNVMFVRVNGQWKCGQAAIKLDGQWVGIEGATNENAIVSNLNTIFGFKQNSAGYFENTNQHEDNSAANCKITVTLTSAKELQIEYNQSSENGYDYGIFSKINTPLSTGYSVDSSDKIQQSLKGKSSGTISYGTLDPGTYTIYVKYRKDGSVGSGDDTLWFKVLNINTVGPTEWERIYDCYVKTDCDCECYDCECYDCIYDCECYDECECYDCECYDCLYDCHVDCMRECECYDCMNDCDCSYEECWWECECYDCDYDDWDCYDCIYDCIYDCDCDCMEWWDECECWDCVGYECWIDGYDCECDECECYECYYDCECYECECYDCECNECNWDCDDCQWVECTPIR